MRTMLWGYGPAAAASARTFHHLDKNRRRSRATSARRRDSLYEPSSATSSPCASTRNKCARASSTSPPRRNRRASAASTTPPTAASTTSSSSASSLRPRTDGAKLVVKVGAKCKVPWGDSSDEYDAEVVALPFCVRNQPVSQVILRIIEETFVNLHDIAQDQLRSHRRADGVGRPKFDLRFARPTQSDPRSASARASAAPL